MRGKYARRARGGAGATAEGVLPAWSGWRRWEMPTPRTLLLLLLGAVLHALGAALWHQWRGGGGGCTDPANREILQFLEGDGIPIATPTRGGEAANKVGAGVAVGVARVAEGARIATASSGSSSLGGLRVSRSGYHDSRDMRWGDFRRADSVLGRPAAEVLGKGILRALAPTINRLEKSFDKLARVQLPSSEIAADTSSDGTSLVPPHYLKYMSGLSLWRQDGGTTAATIESTKNKNGEEDLGLDAPVGTYSVIDAFASHLNVFHRQLRTLELGMGHILTRLPHAEQHQSRSSTVNPTVAVTGVTNPDRLASILDDLAIVITWVNGSDPDVQARRKKRCYEWYGRYSSHCADSDWRVDRIRESAELMFSLRSIEKHMSWFKGDIYLVIAGDRPPAFLETRWDRRHARLKVIPQRDIVPRDFQPTFNSETVKSFLHRIPGIPDHFIVLDDDMMLGRDAPPSVFFTQFGGPILYFENNRVSSNGCPAPASQVWRASVCHTYGLFLDRFGTGRSSENAYSGPRAAWNFANSGNVVPFHYMKHAPLVGVKKVFRMIQEEPKWSVPLLRSHRIPFRSGQTVQTDFLHNHLIRQIDAFDFGVSFGWNADMHLIMLDGSNPGAFERLTEDWIKDSPMFFTINDLGWDKCSVGRRLHWFFQQKYPNPSVFEVPGAETFLSLGFCK